MTNEQLVKESIRRTQARVNRELFLGRGKHSGRLYHLTPEEYLPTYMHLIGAPHFGKSSYLEHLLPSFVDLGIPASIFDPHGDTAKHYYEQLERNPRIAKKLLHLKPGATANTLGFNPFHCGLSEPGEVASLVLEAFIKVWGNNTFNETPRLERILRCMFYMFAANQIPLTQAFRFLQVGNGSFRANLLTAVDDEKIHMNWQEIERLSPREKLDRFESSWNRLQRFFQF